MLVADLTGNGIPDRVFPGAPGGDFAAVRLGNGDGTFRQAPDIPGVYQAAVGDVNGDGIPDLVTIGAYPMLGMTVWLGNGDGTFRMENSYYVGYLPSAIALGELTGTGNLDVVTATSNTLSASVYLGDGHGAFRLGSTYGVGGDPSAVAIANSKATVFKTWSSPTRETTSATGPA
jgi:hypothetical protein